ncbi:MAG: long-chain fatty acid--CoA ligase, partial [Armatimonadota bacterium]
LAQGTLRAQGKSAPLFFLTDRLVGKKVRARAGSSFRYFVSGGAALAPAVAEFFMAFGFGVLQGYGLTETAGGTCVNRPDDNRYWTVGPPLDMEIKIAEDGEILVRGDGLFDGYWNLPEATAAAMTADGWFQTGDIGTLEGANLRITDRKKDILVLGNGKNVAPQPIENKLKAQAHIKEAVVLGDGMESCVALVVPKLEALREELGLAEDAPVSQDARARALIKKEIDAVNKTLNGYELIKKFEILDNPFTQESGELTPSHKVKRRVIKERYADRIEQMRR